MRHKRTSPRYILIVLFINIPYLFNVDEVPHKIRTRDNFLLAALIHSECSICEYDEQVLVGLAVLNRNCQNIDSIIYEDGQFDGVNSSEFYVTKATLKLADSLIVNYTNFPKKLRKIKYFYNPKKSNNHTFFKTLKLVKKKKFHNFYK